MGERPATTARLVSLDAFRGLTIAAMILVNDPGDGEHVYWPLEHAEWNGWTPADLVFPFFLFMVGLSLTLSRRPRASQALARAVRLVGLGLLLALWPPARVATLRWPGVLQRIGVCSLAGWAARRWLAPRGQAVLATLLVVGYWLLMTQVTGPEGLRPSLEPEANLAAQVDRALLGPHVWSVTGTWDPEGVLSTLPAIATTLLGLLAGEWLRSGRPAFSTAVGLLLAGLVLTAAGVAWGDWTPASVVFPINKNLWSSSFVLLTGGLATALFGVTYWVVDGLGFRRWAAPFVACGRNAIALYVGSGLLALTLLTLRWPSAAGEPRSLWERLYAALFAYWLPPEVASLAWALAFVLLFLAAAIALDRRGLYLKV